MNKSIIDRLLYKYQKYDLTDCRIDYETIEKIASEFSILQQKVNQLETNRDEAIELVKEIKLHYQQHPTMIPSVKIDKLLSLLERGKE